MDHVAALASFARHASHHLACLVASHIAGDLEAMDLNLNALDRINSQIATTTAALQATINGDIAAAVAAAKAEAQPLIDKAVADAQVGWQATVDAKAVELQASVDDLVAKANNVNAAAPVAG